MRPSSLLLALLALVVTAGVLATGVLRPDHPIAAGPAADKPASRDAGALAVLRHWDAQRSGAWSRGDAAALRAIYLPGSTAGERDVTMLRAWRARGLRVHGLRMQVLRAQVRVRRDHTIVVRVLDRVARGWVTPDRRGSSSAPSERVRTRLPASVARARTITLVRRDGRWYVAGVRLSPGPWPAPR